MKAIVFLALISAVNGLAAEPSRFEKLNTVLMARSAIDTTDYAQKAKDLDYRLSFSELETALKIADPLATLNRYITVSGRQIEVFKDRDAKQILDYTIALNPEAETVSPIVSKARCTKSQPLTGLKIALDPGHIGTDFWDKLNGKYVTDGKNTILEGDLNLKTVLLVAHDLEQAGAEVFLTRETNRFVTDTPLASYDMTPDAVSNLQNSTDAPWFDAFLNSSPLTDLPLKAKTDPKIAKIFSPSQKNIDYLIKEDLEARARKINAYAPDLSLIIHYDAEDGAKIQSRGNQTLAFVAGNIRPGESASELERFTILGKTLQLAEQQESLAVSKSILKYLTAATGVQPIKSSSEPGWKLIGDGVLARNLALTKTITKGAIAYIEVMKYDYASEFAKLAVETESLCFRGSCVKYSKRLEDVKSGIVSGIQAHYCAVNR